MCIALVDTAEVANRLGRLLCRAGTVVLTIHHETPRRPGESEPLDEAALCWAADHARELGADPARLLLAGEGTDAGSAAWLALRARELDWLSLIGQLLIDPKFGGAVPGAVEGVAAATILTPIDGDEDGRSYASALRAARVRVHEVLYTRNLADPLSERDLVAATAHALYSADERTAFMSSINNSRTLASS